MMMGRWDRVIPVACNCLPGIDKNFKTLSQAMQRAPCQINLFSTSRKMFKSCARPYLCSFCLMIY